MTPSQHLLSAGTIVVTEIYVIQLRVRKIDTFGRQINSQSIRPEDFILDDGRAVVSVHGSALNAGVVAPVCPEQPSLPFRGVERQASRLRDVGVEQHHPLGAVAVRYLKDRETDLHR